MILSTALEWPTLTVQWLPDKQEYAHHHVIGKFQSNTVPGYLISLTQPTAYY